VHGRDPAHYLDNRMTPKQRLDRALQIRAALTALMTDDEADTYCVIDEHLTDYINELALTYSNTLDPL
jgi:aromatic ring-opening dioxygenase LigB subunit